MQATPEETPEPRSTEQCFLSSFQSAIVLVRGKELRLIDLFARTSHLVLKDIHTNVLRQYTKHLFCPKCLVLPLH